MNKEIKQHSIAKDIVFTFLTLGIWNIWVQFRQIEDTNSFLKKDQIPSLFKVFLFSLLTLGLYFCYHEYKLTKILHKLNYNQTFRAQEVSFFILTLLGLWFIVDSYQQMLINRYIEKSQNRK